MLSYKFIIISLFLLLLSGCSSSSIAVIPDGTEMSIDGEVMTIDIAHEKIHEGVHYKTGFQDITMNVDDTITLLFVTPNTSTQMHYTLTSQTTGEAIIYFYEGTVTSSDGTLSTSYNRNRNSLNLSSLLVYKTPTVTTDGMKLSEKWVGSEVFKGDIGGDVRGNSEFILKEDTKYLIRLTAVSDGMKGAIGGDWYEHESH
jgi:hypothetical protein